MIEYEIDDIECAIRHIQTAVDVDPWAAEIAVEAMEKEISALQAQEAKAQLSAEGTTSNLIGRQVAIDAIYKCTDIYINNLPIMIDKAEAYKAISELPPAEPEIVRCKDCKHRGEKPIGDGRYWCDIHDAYMYYCSDAERRTDATDQRWCCNRKSTP